MIALDLGQLSDAEMKEAVIDRCAPFGRVTVLRISRPGNRGGVATATVRMSTVDEADALARYLGDSRRGSNVTIGLAPRIPSATETNLLFRKLAGSAQVDILL